MVLAVYVLDCGDLFESLFNLLALFSKSSGFTKLIGIAASFGLFMAIIRYFKTSNPLTIGKWFMTYMLILNIAIIPKCDVQVFDISTQKTYAIANVPLAVAFLSHSLTTLGYGLAQLLIAYSQHLIVFNTVKPVFCLDLSLFKSLVILELPIHY